jgi:hypothetical protein
MQTILCGHVQNTIRWFVNNCFLDSKENGIVLVKIFGNIIHRTCSKGCHVKFQSLGKDSVQSENQNRTSFFYRI